MIEIVLNNLNSDNCYESTLQTIEKVCDEYGLNNHFGTISMFNQMVCDYLLLSENTFDLNVEFSIFDSELDISYKLETFDFSQLVSKKDSENTMLFVMEKLSDSMEISSDNKQLISTFHVKTNNSSISSKRTLTHKSVYKTESNTR